MRVVPGAFPSRSREIVIVAIVVLLETTVVVEPEGGANVALEEATRAGSGGAAQDAPGPRVEALARGEG
jgi:tetrahydromethanopterin S-methyltransferase subunit D